MPKSVLVVDDKQSVRNMLADYLRAEGFKVTSAANGEEALYAARRETPDMILLDLMMPEMNGYDFMRNYAHELGIPIIVITARVEEAEKVLGLELGADDYVTKPFSLRELTARIHAVLRRTGKSDPERHRVLHCGDLTLDCTGRQVWVAEHEVGLTPSEFELLSALMSAPGRVFTRMDLLERLQGGAYEGAERTIDVHVRNLRTKIERDPGEPVYIETVYGVGYRFCNAW